MATIPEILQRTWPGTEWTIDEDNYETLIWPAGNAVAKPTESDIRSHSDAVDALLADETQRSRQQQALQDAPDYLLKAIETLIEGMIEIRRAVNDIRNTMVGAAHTGSFTEWDAAIVSKIAALRQKVIDLRNIS